MVFGLVKKFGFVKRLTGWTCGINYGQKTTNVVELKYRQQTSLDASVSSDTSSPISADSHAVV